MFSDSWNQKNQWWERIPNQREHVPNWREHILQSEKENSDENSGFQKFQNQNNRGIPWNSKRISQPSLKEKDNTSINFMCLTMIDPATSWFEIIH